MIIIVKLFLAHLIGDFLLQPNSWVTEKETKKAGALKLYLHVLIHAGLLFLFTWNIRLWLPIGIITITHYLIDLLKAYLQKEHTKTAWFVSDQLLHIAVLIIIWLWWFKPDIQLLSINAPVLWIYLTSIFFLTIPTATINRKLLSSWSQMTDENNGSLTNAGTYIGILERLFIFLFIITGHWNAIGFLLAAKSVFRFGDLKESKNRKLTEYILIGTLLSFGIAFLTALVTKKWISLLCA